MKHLADLLKILALVGVISLGAGMASAAELALKGYDPVAYFTEKRATVGNAQFRLEWDGATYQFASAKHLELFKADPDRYLPQYKNWCAASVANGEKVYGEPEYWLVEDGRLYLFGKPVGPNLMRTDSSMKSVADKNWSAVSRLPNPPKQ